MKIFSDAISFVLMIKNSFMSFQVCFRWSDCQSFLFFFSITTLSSQNKSSDSAVDIRVNVGTEELQDLAEIQQSHVPRLTLICLPSTCNYTRCIFDHQTVTCQPQTRCSTEVKAFMRPPGHLVQMPTLREKPA